MSILAATTASISCWVYIMGYDIMSSATRGISFTYLYHFLPAALSFLVILIFFVLISSLASMIPEKARLVWVITPTGVMLSSVTTTRSTPREFISSKTWSMV